MLSLSLFGWQDSNYKQKVTTGSISYIITKQEGFRLIKKEIKGLVSL